MLYSQPPVKVFGTNLTSLQQVLVLTYLTCMRTHSAKEIHRLKMIGNDEKKCFWNAMAIIYYQFLKYKVCCRTREGDSDENAV